MKHCYLMYGQGGEITSHGMDVLADKIREKQLPGMMVHNPCDYGDYGTIVRLIEETEHDDKNVVLGFSLGGNATTNVAMSTRHAIDLLVAIDPSRLGYLYPLPSNVKKAFCFHNTAEWNIIGLGKLTVAKGTDPRILTTISVSGFHLAIDFNDHIHQKIIAELEIL